VSVQSLDQEHGPGSTLRRVFERFSDGARRVVVLAQEEARLLQHNYIGTEHILLGLLHEGQGVAARALESVGVSLEAARTQVEQILGRPAQVPAGHIPFTPRAKKVLELSLREALQLGHNYIGTEHILLGVLREGDGVACQVLVGLSVELATVRQSVMDLLGRMSPEANPGLMRVMSGPALPANVPRACCALCGRDLWEVDHYVSGDTATVCDLCIAAAQRSLHEAPAGGNREVPMPPRVFGPEPSDPQAPHEIEHAFRTVFGGPTGASVDPDTNAALIEDGATLAPLLALAGERHANIQITGARVARIRFLGPDEAEVQYSIQLGHAALPFEGRAVRHDGHWLVSRDTMTRHLTQGGIQVPPPE
jgi:hypothetical protein